MNGDLPDLAIEGMKVLNVEVADSGVNPATWVRSGNNEDEDGYNRFLQSSSGVTTIDISIV
eukprot:14026649-Ditylum_brightwellii.AAC.1